MNLKEFMDRSGFKVLSMAKLDASQSAIVFYLLNCAVSGLDQIITSNQELSELIGLSEDETKQALSSLEAKGMIKIRSKDGGSSSYIQFIFDLNLWANEYLENLEPKDAKIYPFKKIATLKPLENMIHKETHGGIVSEHKSSAPTWQRVLDAILTFKEIGPTDLADEELNAKKLIDLHPVDHILLLIRHFKNRIPSLGLLVHSWHHFQELYENESQHVDFVHIRKSNMEMDQKLKDSAKKWLADSDLKHLSADEVAILKLFMTHKNPRRQLFWAYQLRSRYQNLSDFFLENMSIMMPVSTKPQALKRPSLET